MFEKICEIITTPRAEWSTIRFTRISKLRFMPFWWASFLFFIFCVFFCCCCSFMRPSFHGTVSFVKSHWKISRLLKNFNSLIIFFSQRRLTNCTTYVQLTGSVKIAPQKISPYENCPLWKYLPMKVTPLWNFPPLKITPFKTAPKKDTPGKLTSRKLSPMKVATIVVRIWKLLPYGPYVAMKNKAWWPVWWSWVSWKYRYLFNLTWIVVFL